MSVGRLIERRTELEKARSNFSLESDCPSTVNTPIWNSWQRSRRQTPAKRPLIVESDELQHRWSRLLISRYANDILDQLEQLVTSEEYVAAITDRHGVVVWSAGSPMLAPQAEQSEFVLGSCWAEDVAGTNGPGTALRTGQPVSVFASEHWSEQAQDWACYATPIHDSAGRVIGVLDLSSNWQAASGLALATVVAFGQLIDQRIRLAPQANEQIQVTAMGNAEILVGGQTRRIPMRQVEILVLLSCFGPSTLDQLHERLYGDRPISKNTTKSEIWAIRRMLGREAISSRPYKLEASCTLDVVTLLDALEKGDVDVASRLYTAQLLPDSESPALTELRHRIDATLRAALLAKGTAAQLEIFSNVHPFDRGVNEHGLQRSHPGSPRADLFRYRLGALM